jgi:protein-S-isoprenylcysteine O-methyltransferase Ste14
VVLLTGFLGAFAVLLTAGTTATTLGPRWLGIVLLVLATGFLVLALRELRAAWRLRLAQVRRRRAERLTTRDV